MACRALVVHMLLAMSMLPSFPKKTTAWNFSPALMLGVFWMCRKRPGSCREGGMVTTASPLRCASRGSWSAPTAKSPELKSNLVRAPSPHPRWRTLSPECHSARFCEHTAAGYVEVNGLTVARAMWHLARCHHHTN